MVDVNETYPILDDVEVPPAKAVAAHPKKSHLNPIKKTREYLWRRT